ncbi:MAG: ATP-binding protein [Spirochaetaceae bacterium]|jgi:predicted AAA+ superfamily ATPase|nr:ATP-binding protein [Spirochaetaceae bacterium]
MKDIPRAIQHRILKYLKPQKAALIFGARRVGKTRLIHQILKTYHGRTLLLNGEDYDTWALLEQRSAANYRRLLAGIEVFALDEAQNVPDIGQKLKLMADEVPYVRLIASGSSSFDLLNKAGEPLVGRSAQFLLTPFSQKEIAGLESSLETRQYLEDRLLYGSYPEVIFMKNHQEKEEYLRELVNAYLLKDILSIEGIKNSGKMRDLLRLISFQMGNEVVYDELGKQLGMSKNTVEKYLDLLSKVFVIYRLGSYARNLRKEVTKAGKWYFYDNGIRNALIGNFRPLSLRQDTGILWEAYIIGERIKRHYNTGSAEEFYFWRTYDHQEIDLIEAEGENLSAFEFKWGDKHPKIPTAFAGAYPDAEYRVINRENYLEYINPQGEHI